MSVGITAAIGVLALVIAILTVFQGILAQGPGRLKSSRAAIGPWAARTITKLNLGEFRFRSTAYVPYLRENVFLSAVSIPQDDSKIKKGRLGLVKQTEWGTYPAGWYLLLRELGLVEVNFELLPCQTDYLPSDIQAAPVYGEVSCIVLLAAISGCDTITNTPNGFPVARGSSNQLTFREHPQLGMVAVYEEFPLSPTYVANLEVQIYTSLQLAFGFFFFRTTIGICILPKFQDLQSLSHFSCGDVFLHGLKSISGDCHHEECNAPIPKGQPPNVLVLCLLAAHVPLCTRVFPSELLRLHETVFGLMSLSRPWLLGISGVNIWGVRDAIQQCASAKGGTARWVDENQFGLLPMISDRFNEQMVAWGRVYGRAQFSLWNGSCSWASPDRRSRDLLGDAPESADRPNWVILNPSATEIVILTHVMGWCWRWGVEDEKSILSLQYSEKSVLCSEIVFQLQELDWWLDVHGGEEASCGARKLYAETLESEISGDGEEEGPSRAINEDGMRSLLVYRAALMGLNLALAADNSSVCGTELGRRAVRVL